MLTSATTKVSPQLPSSLPLPLPLPPASSSTAPTTSAKTSSALALVSTQTMTTRVMSTSGLMGSSNSNSGAGTSPASRTSSVKTTATTTTITSDPGILCFHHCNVKVFCFTLPHICPQCKTPLDTHPSGGGTVSGSGSGGVHKRRKNKKRTSITNNAEAATTKEHLHLQSNGGDVNNDNNRDDNDEPDDKDNDSTEDDADRDDDGEDDDSNDNDFVCHIMAGRLLPFRLPYPFVRANQYPCAIVLRPTTGDFLNDYNNTTDLHIAVTTSTGCVVEFDRHGLRRHRTDNMSDWWQCLLVGDVPEPWYDYWDQVLFEVCQQPDKWTVSHYHEDKHNCYTFVLTFLQALTYDKLSEAATSKTTFCEKYIVPRTTTAGKYISLYRKLRDTGIYVHHTNHNKHHHRHGSHASKTGKHQQQQQQQFHQHQQQQLQQHNKFNNSGIATTAKSSLVSSPKQQHHQPNTNQVQQHQHQHHSNHHHHHSIISRPHSTLCTIEE